MNRFHVHLHVADLAASIRFYSRLFGAEPTRHEVDYAKWMLEDPRLNFAISTRGEAGRIDHLGFQADSDTGLAALKTRAHEADAAAVLDEGNTTCCYARSEKHWITDPQGVAWEQFQTLGDIPVFGKPARKADEPAAATTTSPAAGGRPLAIPVVGAARSACC
jgi:lactoylglutathione lyase